MILSLILLQVVTFVVILLVMRFLFGSQLKSALNRLQVLHQDSLEKEEILNKELERAKTQVDAEIARAKEEAKLIVDTAKRNAEKLGLEASARAQAEAKKMLDESTDKAKRLEAEILASSEEKALTLAQELIRFTLAQTDQKALHTQLIDEFIEELKKVDKEKLTVATDHALVLTPQAMTSQEQQVLKAVLSSKLGIPVSLEEKVDVSIVGGMVVKLGGLIIDGSLKNKFNRALNALRLKKA
ncbi:MAG: F0F1 ATP synthase subunit delta [Candidatus Omnitrophica bacterium]|nr:F0F1 ATP synthase subunit delta [Candidatus Omnitrophota bacterium]